MQRRSNSVILVAFAFLVFMVYNVFILIKALRKHDSACELYAGLIRLRK